MMRIQAAARTRSGAYYVILAEHRVTNNRGESGHLLPIRYDTSSHAVRYLQERNRRGADLADERQDSRLPREEYCAGAGGLLSTRSAQGRRRVFVSLGRA